MIFDTSLDAVAAKKPGDKLMFYRIGERYVLAQSMQEARTILTEGLVRMSNDDLFAAMQADVRKGGGE